MSRQVDKFSYSDLFGFSIQNSMFSLRIDTKKGVPLYSNLVNLKSNTMKNTMQRYDYRHNLASVFHNIFLLYCLY